MELVIFPKAWQRSKELIRNNEVVLVKGKLDNSQADIDKNDADNSGISNGDAEKEKKFRDGTKVLVDSMEAVPIIPEDAAPAELLPEDLAGRPALPHEPDFETEFVPPDNLDPNNGINDQKIPAYSAVTALEKPAAAQNPKVETPADSAMAAHAQAVIRNCH